MRSLGGKIFHGFSEFRNIRRGGEFREKRYCVMASEIETKAALCRRAAAEYKLRAEQEMHFPFYLQLHRQWLRQAIVYEEEAQVRRRGDSAGINAGGPS